MLSETERLHADLRSTLATSQSDGQSLVTALFLVSVIQALTEQHWILTRGDPLKQRSFDAFVPLALSRELEPLAFLKPWFGSQLSTSSLKAHSTAARNLARTLITEATRYDRPMFHTFLRAAVRAMADLCVFEERLADNRQDDFLPPLAYRAFDAFDEIFGLFFGSDRGMIQDPTSRERLYIGGGAGVQTSYATILTALEKMRLPKDGHLIDLGSGFGRVGLIAGLWREDLRFTGYEYVAHRAKVANDSAERAGHADRIRFFARDLADASFQIPLADAYYMYDPFCPTTYERVIRQLNAFSRDHRITVVTKADASNWLLELQSLGSWHPPETHDSGLLLMFRSKPM